MAKIMDKNSSKFVRYGSYICVWEVYTFVYDEYAEEDVEERKAVFYDPYKAMTWAIENFGMRGKVQASLFKPEWCK